MGEKPWERTKYVKPGVIFVSDLDMMNVHEYDPGIESRTKREGRGKKGMKTRKSKTKSKS